MCNNKTLVSAKKNSMNLHEQIKDLEVEQPKSYLDSFSF